ncbi:unnamed protein product [Amoebophrya sp. A120]|nr:unnamed protein product [Amoebophrya sp. A120]|eukprot:GSA120T00009964001.1
MVFGTPKRGGSNRNSTSSNGLGSTPSNNHSHQVMETIEVLVKPGMKLYWKAEPKNSITTKQLPENAYHHPDGNYNFRLLNLENELGYRFDTDLDICYQPFAKDFGPLNLAVIWRYCRLMEQVMDMDTKTITHECDTSDLIRLTNSVFLISSYCIVKEGATAKQMHDKFRHLSGNFVPYRDASSCASLWDLDMLSALEGLELGVKFGWFDFKTFDADEYEHFEKVESGDLNWILPGKIIAFATPQNRARDMDGYTCWTPESYLPLWKKWNVGLVVRLNKATVYDREKFIKNGVKHLDLYFNDGGLPPIEHIHQFLHAVENEPGAVAVHCKAGLGRTGTLIGAYMMKHYKIPAKVFISWNRLVRPGSVLGPQQQFLCDIEQSMHQMHSAQVPRIVALRPQHGVGHPIRVIDNPNYGRAEGSNGGSAVKSSYGQPAGAASLGVTGKMMSVEQQGQGDWLLSQKRRAQGFKTTYNTNTPGAFTYKE